MNIIDTVTADTLASGDLTEFWTEDDTEEGRYVIETVTRVEDDDDMILVYTEENDGDPWAVEPHALMRLFSY